MSKQTGLLHIGCLDNDPESSPPKKGYSWKDDHKPEEPQRVLDSLSSTEILHAHRHRHLYFHFFHPSCLGSQVLPSTASRTKPALSHPPKLSKQAKPTTCSCQLRRQLPRLRCRQCCCTRLERRVGRPKNGFTRTAVATVHVREDRAAERGGTRPRAALGGRVLHFGGDR